MVEYTNWGQIFYDISPYSWAYVGIGIALGASVIGAAWYFFQFIKGHIYFRSKHPRRSCQSTQNKI